MGELRPFARRDGREARAFGGASLPQGLSANDHEPTSTERARQILWVLVGLFAIESAAGLLYPGVVAITALHLVLMVGFAMLHVLLRYGWKGALAFAVFCLVVSNIFENVGVATGFPFGNYHYTDALGPKLGYVPLMIGPAYLGVGYLSWVMGTSSHRGRETGRQRSLHVRDAIHRRLRDCAVGSLGSYGVAVFLRGACRCRTTSAGT